MGADRDNVRPRSRPRRVLMTADTVGGVWTYAIELSRALAARDHEIVLATMGALPTREQRREALAIEGLELCPSAYKLIWMDDPWRDIAAAEDWLKGIAQRFRPDIVHLNDLGHGDGEWQAPLLVVGHSCVLSWWQAVHGEPAPREWSRYHRRVRANLRAADLVLAPTRAMLEALERHYGPLHATRVIANGKRARRSAALEKSPLVFSAGRAWDEGKNIAALARAARHIAWPVAVAGETRRADGTGPALGGVQLLGPLDRESLAEWYARASIYVAPARYEPFGLGILEAAAAGAALVLGDIESLREVWGDAALFVAPDDDAALARAVSLLIDDPERCVRYALRAQRRAAGYTPAVMADAYARAYIEIALGRERPRAASASASIGAAP
jgi:glycosyltransferase involved in cell wall biosynthesis